MKIERLPMSDELKQTLAANLKMGARARRRDQARRRALRFPIHNRWLIVRARTRVTWRQVWLDLCYLVRGW